MIRRKALIMNVLYTTLFLLTVQRTFAQEPIVTLDANTEIEGISPSPEKVIADETILLAVTVQNVHNLHSYSVKFSFDSQVVTFKSAMAALSPLTPVFLETNKGHLAAFMSMPGEGTAEIAATQIGKDSSTCVSGDGVLGYLSFRAKTKGNPQIRITDVQLVDPDGTVTPVEIRQ